MKRTFHLLGQAVPLVLLWAAIVEIGFRMQQYFGPLYDLDMGSSFRSRNTEFLGRLGGVLSKNVFESCVQIIRY